MREVIRPGVRAVHGSTRGPVAPTTHRPGERLLRADRSRAYLDAIRRLDVGGTMTAPDLADVIDRIRREFDEKWAPTPLGLVATCFLGPPYEVHILSLVGEIVQHFEAGHRMPDEFERARSVATDDAYLAIEVYANKLICVRADGSNVVVEG